MLEGGAVGQRGNFGLSWAALCVAFGLHAWDESVHHFLDIYNPTVLTLYGHFSWFPRMELTPQSWLAVVVGIELVMVAMTPLAYRNTSWARGVAYSFGSIMCLNGISHILMTIRGRTVPSVEIIGMAPGTYTAPLLLLSAAYLFWSLRQSARRD